MVYIIQTNTSLDGNDNPKDFQNLMFTYPSWEEYIEDLTNEDIESSRIIGTMIGNLKPRECKIENILINDDFHFECIVNRSDIKFNLKAYKVNQEQFNNLL